MIQPLQETGKSKKSILQDSYTKYFQIFSNSTDPNNCETWTNMKNFVKLFFKSFHKSQSKPQEFSNKAKFNNNKTFKLPIN